MMLYFGSSFFFMICFMDVVLFMIRNFLVFFNVLFVNLCILLKIRNDMIWFVKFIV